MHGPSIHEEAGPAGGRISVSRAAILDEVTALCAPPGPVAEDEVTIGQVAERWGCSVSTAERRLIRAVADGTLERRQAVNPETGRACWAYRVL